MRVKVSSFLLALVCVSSLSSGCREMAGKKKNKSPSAVDEDKKKSSKSKKKEAAAKDQGKAAKSKDAQEPSGS